MLPIPHRDHQSAEKSLTVVSCRIGFPIASSAADPIEEYLANRLASGRKDLHLSALYPRHRDEESSRVMVVCMLDRMKISPDDVHSGILRLKRSLG